MPVAAEPTLLADTRTIVSTARGCRDSPIVHRRSMITPADSTYRTTADRTPGQGDGR